MNYSCVPERGWDVLPSFVGDGFLSAEIFHEVQQHPLLPGESAWGTRNLLHALILSTRPRVVVEIGAHIGAGSLAIGSALRANGFGKSYHLEPQEQYYRVLRDFINRAGLDDYAYPLQMSSSNPVLPSLVDHEAELIFLDANHDYSEAYHDLMICDLLLSREGFVLVEDVAREHSEQMCAEARGGVRRALIDYVAARPDFSLMFLEPPLWLNPCGLAIMARKPADQLRSPSPNRQASLEVVD